MSNIINHDLRVNNGSTLYMPPWESGNDKWGNLALPSVYTGSTTQEYPTGTIYRNGLRTFIYTLLDAIYYGEEVGGSPAAIGAGYLSESRGEYVNLTDSVIAGAAGATSVTVTRASTPVNSFAGGFIAFKHSTSGRQTVGRYSNYQIISNTVQDGSNIVTFELDGAIVLALTTTTDTVLSAHPYALTGHPQTETAGCGMGTGVFMYTTVASHYCWLQTGGPNNMILPWGTHEGGTRGSVPVHNIGGVAQQTTAINVSTLYSGYEAAAHQCIGWSYPSTSISDTPTDNSIAIACFLKIFN